MNGMIYLFLCILSSTGIFLVFKYLDRYQLPAFPVIVINYLTAATLGFMINQQKASLNLAEGWSWVPLSLIIGVLFIVMFFVIARSSASAGLSVTTVASKMSVVFPITFSLIIDDGDMLNLVKMIGILAALTGVFLTVWKPRTIAAKAPNQMLLPLTLFVGMGIVDSLVKSAQHYYVDNEVRALFSAVLFSVAFLTGIIILPFRGKLIPWFGKGIIWFWGILLGTCNFGSIFFMVSALNYSSKEGHVIDSSIVFGANNIGIVTLSVLAGLIIFSERLRWINWVGIGFSLVAIILFMWS